LDGEEEGEEEGGEDGLKIEIDNIIESHLPQESSIMIIISPNQKSILIIG
jgi:hypothetical protein